MEQIQDDYRSGSLDERSDIIWVKIPDYNTVNSGGEIVGRSSNKSSTTVLQQQRLLLVLGHKSIFFLRRYFHKSKFFYLVSTL